MLNKLQVKHYREQGYLFPNYSLPQTVLDEIRIKHSNLVKEYPEFRDNCPDLLNFDKSFLKYALNGKILKMVAQLIGPDILLWNMSFFAKPALNGKKTPWHQDGQYWPINPLATCTVWIAIDDATPQNGCMRFLPGSHKKKQIMQHIQRDNKNYTLQQELQPHEYNEKQAINVSLKAGSISFHDVYLIHGSDVNLSKKPRRGMTLRLMPASSHYDRSYAAQIAKERGDYDGTDRHNHHVL